MGRFGEQFGQPRIEVDASGTSIRHIRVMRGAPCGATWAAASRMKGVPCDQAAHRYALEVQYFCFADPSAWDPVSGSSPLHFAGKIHAAAMKKALGKRME